MLFFLFFLMNPRSIAYDAAGKILVVGQRVSAWTLEGQPVHQWGQGTVKYAYGVAIDTSATSTTTASWFISSFYLVVMCSLWHKKVKIKRQNYLPLYKLSTFDGKEQALGHTL